MNINLLRAGALGCALLTTTALTNPALAQSVSDIPPPVRYQVDENGVDVTRAVHNLSFTDLAIGPDGPGGLAYVRQSNGSEARNSYDMGVFEVNGVWTATLGLAAYKFAWTGSAFAAADGSGATLTRSGSSYTLTTAEGVAVVYDYALLASEDVNRQVRATSIAYPTGERITLTWVRASWCAVSDCSFGGTRTAVRLQSVSSSLGFQLHFQYARATVADAGDALLWQRLNSITAINTTIDACSPTANSCSYSQDWPTVSYSGSEVTDPVGRERCYTSSATAFAIRRSACDVGSDNIVYNYSSGRISSVVRDGLTWDYAYSVSGDTATMTATDPGGHDRTIVSSLSVGLPKSVTDEVGQTTTYTYDSAGRLTRMTAPEGNYVELTYDGRGNVTETRRVAKANSDLADIVTTASYPSSCANVLTCNQPASTTDALGHTTNYSYDPTHGGLLTVTLPAPSSGAVRPQTRIAYSALTAPGGGTVYRPTNISQCETLASCNGTADEVQTVIAYADPNLSPSSISTGAGDGSLTATTAFAYSDRGALTTINGPLPGTADVSRLFRDVAGQLIGTISPDPDGSGPLSSRAQRITYHDNGQVSRIEDGTVPGQAWADWKDSFVRLARTDIYYDSKARPATQVAYEPIVGGGADRLAVTQFGYDEEGRLACTAVRMNPAMFDTLPAACTLGTAGSYGPDRITHYVYDAANRIAQVQTGYGTADQAEVTYSYRANGQVSAVLDANGNRTAFYRDGHDRLSQIVYPMADTPGASNPDDRHWFQYDAAGNVTRHYNRSNHPETFEYDALNRRTDWHRYNGSTVSYGYDNLSRLTSAVEGTFALSFAYDALGRQTGETGPLGTVGSAYDVAGRRTRLTHPSTFFVDYDYLVTGEMTKARINGATSGSNIVATYTYDDLGRRTSLTRGNGIVTSYAYDELSRLTSLSHNPDGTDRDLTLTFAYNPAGEIVSRTASDDSYSFRGLANGSISDTHNGLNQIVTTNGTPVVHSARGDTIAIGADDYVYNDEDQLVSAPGGVTLSYDPLGRLYRVSSPAGSRRFIWDGWTILGEFGDTSSLHRYVHGAGVDEPVAWDDRTQYPTITRRYFHADERGSIVGTSNSYGNMYSVTAYDDYGRTQTSGVLDAVGNRFGYTGQMWIPEIGMYYYRARFYNPLLPNPRFMQPDPAWPAGGMNGYNYGGRNPINFTDPMGLAAIETEPPKCIGQCITVWGTPIGQVALPQPGWVAAGWAPLTYAPPGSGRGPGAVSRQTPQSEQTPTCTAAQARAQRLGRSAAHAGARVTKAGDGLALIGGGVAAVSAWSLNPTGVLIGGEIATAGASLGVGGRLLMGVGGITAIAGGASIREVGTQILTDMLPGSSFTTTLRSAV